MSARILHALSSIQQDTDIMQPRTTKFIQHVEQPSAIHTDEQTTTSMGALSHAVNVNSQHTAIPYQRRRCVSIMICQKGTTTATLTMVHIGKRTAHLNRCVMMKVMVLTLSMHEGA